MAHDVKSRIIRARLYLRTARVRVRRCRRSDLPAQAIIREQLVIASWAGRRVNTKPHFARAMAGLAEEKELQNTRTDASLYLPLIRYLQLDLNPATANRNAAIVEICVRNGWSDDQINDEITLKGPTRLIAAFHKKKRGLRATVRS